MQIKSAVFTTSARDIQSAPDWHLPEFAFIGRSNVGKSSMINMLTNKDALAKVSATPGKTQLLNFFVINQSWSLVDLPGYGYAKVAKSEKINFNESVGDYIAQRQSLRRVFVLIDSRLPPQRIDLDFIQWIEGCSIDLAFVFTKADKQSAKKTQETINHFTRSIPQSLVEVSPMTTSSSKERTGRTEILRLITQDLQS